MKRTLLYLGLIILSTFLMLGLLTLKDYSVVPPIKDDLTRRTLTLIGSLEMPKEVEVAYVVKIVPTVPTPPPVASGNCFLAFNYPWPQNIAYAICMAESGGRADASNWSDNHMSWAGCLGSFGLMQLNCSNGKVYDGAENMRIAYNMYVSWGNSFRAWTTCYKIAGCR